MSRVTVVGSGASALHFAQSALERGHEVTMLDVGRTKPEPVRPDDGFRELKRGLDDPAAYFLGDDFSGMLWPGAPGEYYGFPPHKRVLFRGHERFVVEARGFEPLSSFARGGLAEAWTGGAFPFNDQELADWPIGYRDLEPYYGRVAERIGIGGADDDLARFLPVHAHLGAPLDLDEHSRRLLEGYARKRAAINGLGVWLGRSRTATLAADTGDRRGCTYLGRCLWGCPRDALYTPVLTLHALLRHECFRYRSGVYVTHFEADDGGRVRKVHCATEAGGREAHDVEWLALGAGTLSTARIFLESLARVAGEAPELGGLMDNRQILLPFVNLGMLARPYDPATYQYHNLALGLEAQPAKEYVHGLITTLKTALIHPIAQSVPFDLKSSIQVFRNVHAALGILNVNLHDDRRGANSVALERSGDAGRLVVHYAPSADEPARVARALKTLKRALRKLGCIAPPGMQHTRPMGASVHYAGTLPMSTERRPLTASPDCVSHDFDNLLLVDGSTFPFLPAKNLTFTLMANAARVADRVL